MISYQVRRYEESDHDDVWTLHNLALNEVGAHAGNGPWDNDLHHVEDVYLQNGGEFLVAVHEGQVVGMGALKSSTDDRAEITRMRVHPDCQRRGIGQAILDSLESRAVELGYLTLHLDTTTVQTKAQKFYIANGYQETGRHMVGQFEVIFFEKNFGQ